MKDEIKEIERILATSGKYITYAERCYVLDYITNLLEKLDQYENPDDMTLFYMWLDEKAKDKIKQLQKEKQEMKDGWQQEVYDKNEILNKWYETQGRIDKANKILGEILVVSDWEHEGRFRPVKGTTAQDVYKAVCMLYGILETPYRSDYGALTGDTNE